MKKKHFYHYIQEEKHRRIALEQDLSLRLRQQEAIAWLGEYALTCKNLDDLLGETARVVTTTLGMEFCKILELLPGGNELFLRAGVGWKEGLVGKATIGTGKESQAGYTLLTNETVIVTDLPKETRFSGPKLLLDHQVVSGMSVIIHGREKPFGVFGVHTAQQRNFYRYDPHFIEAVASILASAIEGFRIEDELRRSRDELAIILNGVTEGITVQNLKGNLAYANQAAARILGYETAQELLETPLLNVMNKFTLLDENGNPFPAERLPGRLVLGGASNVTARICFREVETGEENWSIVDAAPILDSAGHIVQTVNIFRNISDFVLSERHQKLLAEAGALLASSLDYETTLANVAQLAVTKLADWCTVHLVKENQEVYQLVVAHRDPAKQEMALEYQRKFPPNLNSGTGVAKVLHTGQAEYFPVITDAMLVASARSEEHLAQTRALGMRSVIVVPLISRERILGAITLIWAESGHQYTQQDIDLVNDLARRAAMAIDNALLYQAAQLSNADLEQRVALRTQQLEDSNQQLIREVEERSRAESALRKSELLLNSIFESAPDATILIDLKGKIVRANQQAEMIFGYLREELVGSSMDHLLTTQYRLQPTQDRSLYYEEMAARFIDSRKGITALHRDGSVFPIDITLSPVHTEDGELVICAIRDITEQERLQSELAETHRRLFESVEAERLLISQELHDGPIQELYGLGLGLESINEESLSPEEVIDLRRAKENVQTIIQSLRGLCGELRPPTLTHFGLEKAIRSHLMKIRLEHPELNIESYLASDGSVLSERVRLTLYRVYQNSISNIIRHAQAAHVLIDFRIEEGNIYFLIRDNGRGFLVPQKWVDLVRGGHFGLVGMMERVEAIGGQLTIASDIGKGTTIQVNVPIELTVASDDPLSLTGNN